jgi:replicative DNA helicase
VTGVEAAASPLACPQAEAAVLGAAMLAPRHAAALLDDLAGDDFADPRHRDVHGAIRRLLAAAAPPDPVAVLGELRRSGVLPSTADRGPGNLLHDLLETCPVPAAAEHYRRIVREHAFRRRARQAGERIAQAAEGAGLAELGTLLAAELTAVVTAAARCGAFATEPVVVA